MENEKTKELQETDLVSLKEVSTWILDNGDEYGGDPTLGINTDQMVEDLKGYFKKKVLQQNQTSE